MDWETFASLSDNPFANTDAMREQFEDSANVIRRVSIEPVVEGTLKYHQDGSRLIFAKVIFPGSTERPIILTLHSTSAGPESEIGVWTFYQEIDFG